MSETPTSRVGKPWTDDEERYLQWNWGVLSLYDIAKKLDRTPWGVSMHATKLNLGRASRGTWSIKELAKYTGFSEEKIVHVIKKLGLNIARAWSGTPRRGTHRKTTRKAITDEQAEEITNYMLEHPYVFTDKPGMTRTTAGVWGVGRKPTHCVKCGRNDRPHAAKGFCTSCYQAKFRREAPKSKNPTGRAAWDNPVLTVEKVVEIRQRRFKGATLDSLAIEFGVTRQAISQIVKGRVWKHAGGPIFPYTHNNIYREGTDEHRDRGEGDRREADDPHAEEAPQELAQAALGHAGGPGPPPVAEGGGEGAGGGDREG